MKSGFTLNRLPGFIADYEEFFTNLAGLSEQVALRHYSRFETAITERLLENPYTFAPFWETGSPYRAKLFPVGKKAFWIVYTVDDKVVTLHRFWDCSRETGTHDLPDRPD